MKLNESVTFTSSLSPLENRLRLRSPEPPGVLPDEPESDEMFAGPLFVFPESSVLFDEVGDGLAVVGFDGGEVVRGFVPVDT